MIEVSDTLRFLPFHVVHPRANFDESLLVAQELESLIDTYGGDIVERIMQKIDRPHMHTYIGSGKMNEVSEITRKKKIDIVVLNAMVKVGQLYELRRCWQKINPKIQVWDRVDLILQIFDKHATTTEAKLQIDLARMRYMGPQIYGMGFVMSRQGGGIGTLGLGETNTELMKRHWRNEMKKITDQLDKISKTREQQLERRKKSGFRTVSIVGYTNAGKSSLFNILTGKQTKVQNALFATLDSTVGKVYVKDLGGEILLTDTIGFIRDLPPRLIKAFMSTLIESMQADILLHVIDASDVEYEKKIAIVNEVFVDLGKDTKDAIYVFNKTDKTTNLDKEKLKEMYGRYSPVFVSVKTGEGIDLLKEQVAKRLFDKT